MKPNQKKPDEKFVGGAKPGSSMVFDLSFNLAEMRLVATTKRRPGVKDEDVYGHHQPMKETLTVGLPPHWTYREIDRKATRTEVIYTYELDDGRAALRAQAAALEAELKETQAIAERAIFNQGWKSSEVAGVLGCVFVIGAIIGAWAGSKI